MTEWLEQHAKDFDCTCQTREDLALIALQGPEASTILSTVLKQTKVSLNLYSN